MEPLKLVDWVVNHVEEIIILIRYD